ncbi:M48 family metallopeptidase [Brumimicrobium oceani]|uniref:Peptidase M48 domain-containing protein n=1 Tax=Brumimicrobium oceani TaxID=2100725 RepID=A0A2U2XBL2_9FLAO|nr:M48 family metallopeptidase [Brumimicrobium oceani]PWH85140.1 hypothetical protein DIT68_10920 [Brumimicrobium oceani]
MKLQHFKIFITLLFINPALVLAQDDFFTDFNTTQAEGKAPTLFTTSFSDKVALGIENARFIDKESKEEYAKYTNYALNNLLKTGLVLYGDPMTKYVEKVAANLLKNEARLRRDLQFYVITTNITNALCTDPGVIFITTGLLSQIENEAQLAYVLSHEIVHYQKKHLQKSYSQSKAGEIDPTSSYEDLVTLSKDHEFEADKDALKLYHAAGYAAEEVNTVFDVLMYSYLPFDEIIIDSSFFGNPKIYIPLSLFPENPNPILAFEDYDDSKSTHPNIRKRRAAIEKEIKNYKDWKNNINFINDEEFKTIQNIARFESVRENLLKSEFIKALYEIYILEKQFPGNKYLQMSKALAWASLNQISVSRKLNRITQDYENKEGSISLLYGFFKNISQDDLTLLSLRQIEDIYKQYPNSKRLEEIRTETISTLARSRNFRIDELENISFYDALEQINQQSDSSSTKTENEEKTTETKYDRIRRMREQQSVGSSKSELTQENYAKFLLYDLVKNGEFHEVYNDEKQKHSKRKVVRYNNESSLESIENVRQSDIILLAPVLTAEYKEKFDLEATLQFTDYLGEGINKHAPKGRLKNTGIAISEDFSTEKYNESALINSFLIQSINNHHKDLKTLWVDYEQMKELLNTYNDPYLMIIYGNYYYNKSTDKAVTGSARYIHISTGEIFSSRAYDSRHKLGKLSVEGLAHLVFSYFD